MSTILLAPLPSQMLMNENPLLPSTPPLTFCLVIVIGLDTLKQLPDRLLTLLPIANPARLPTKLTSWILHCTLLN